MRERGVSPATHADLSANHPKVCAVIVTYHPDADLLQRVVTGIAHQVHSTVIVDNTPAPGAPVLAQLEAEGKVIVDRLNKNCGIAVAQNHGIARARKIGCTHILFLDQDSVPTNSMVETLGLYSRRLSGELPLAAVGPRYLDPVTGHSSFFVQFGTFGLKRIWCGDEPKNKAIEVDFMISSGSLVSLEVLDEVGGMDDGLFIDHVDTEWFLRAHAKGYRSFGICDAVMEHRLGHDTQRIWLGRWRHVPQHSPLRHYYVLRNSVMLYKRDYVPLRWIAADVLRNLMFLMYYPVFSTSRCQHLKMMVLGLSHGIRGRMGSFDEATSL